MTYLIDETDNRNKILKNLMKNNNFNVDTYESNKCLSKTDKLIFAPNKKFDKDFCNSLPNGITIFSGNIPQEVEEIFKQKNISHKNFMQDEIFAIQNSHLTAEGILSLLISQQPKSIFAINVLILGGGRVGKTLALLLNKLGIQFDIVAHSQKTFESCVYFSNSVIFGDEFKEKLSQYDVIVNSIPSEILTNEDIEKIKPGCLFLEISSIQTIKKEKLDFVYELCPALPQKFSASSAGKLLFDCFLRLNKD